MEERIEDETNLFSCTTEEMMKRAKASVLLIAESKTRKIKAFAQDVDKWKKKH